jgi:hypothetical protein
MLNLPLTSSTHVQPRNRNLLRYLQLIVVAAAGGCVGMPEEAEIEVETGEVESAGLMNGLMNGFFHPEGLTEYLTTECPLLKQRLLQTGNLTQPFPSGFSSEITKPVCEKFMLYTVQLMVPTGQTLNLYAGNTQVASFAGGLNMQHLVRQVYPHYTFAQNAFTPAYPVARKVVTQGYAALTNGITRRVSYRTNIPAMDAHRQPVEDNWPRELLQLVPFSPAGLTRMANNPAFLARQPDFFNSCDTKAINYKQMEESDAPASGCSLPIVVHGNVGMTQDVIPGRSCRILQPGETLPAGASLSGDVVVPQGGCPLIYYAGRRSNEIIYDDASLNSTNDGCDVVGPSKLTNCKFKVIMDDGKKLKDKYLAYWVFNVEPKS